MCKTSHSMINYDQLSMLPREIAMRMLATTADCYARVP